MEQAEEPIDWAVYRIGQEIFRRHIPLIERGEWQLKSDTLDFEWVHEYRDFNFGGEIRPALVLALSRGQGDNEQERLVRGVGQVAIDNYRIAVEYSIGPELHLELHIKLRGRDIGTAIQVRYFERWFPEDSCIHTFPDGDMSLTDPNFFLEWNNLFPNCDRMSGAYRSTLVPGQTRLCPVNFYASFATIPTVNPVLLSRNVPIWLTIPMTIEAKDITRTGFVLCMTIPPNAPIHRVVASWEAWEPPPRRRRR